MITQLYTFSVGSYVVADEWNANFRTIYNANLAHVEAIQDAYNTLAFIGGDLSDVFNAVKSQPNSFEISGNNVTLSPECEYYKTLYNGESLSINVPSDGLDSEARILLKIENDESLQPFSINYSGGIINFNDYGIREYKAGFYYLLIYESNGQAQVKLIWTGV